jgi:hypothetical protein
MPLRRSKITRRNYGSVDKNQLPVYKDYVNLLGEIINDIKRNTEGLIEASKDIGLAVTAE